MRVCRSGTPVVVFDTRHLLVTGAYVNDTDAPWGLGAPAITGDTVALHVELPPALRGEGATATVGVEFSTTPSGTACQWVPREATASGVFGTLYTLVATTHARELFPCQDTPAVRATYAARINIADGSSPRLVALMSAVLTGVGDTFGVRSFSFEQQIPVPAHLVTLVVGHFERREIGPRTAVFADPKVISRAADNFRDSERVLGTLEGLLVPYEFRRHDVVVLPPSFPGDAVGAPCLTLVSPTLVTHSSTSSRPVRDAGVAWRACESRVVGRHVALAWVLRVCVSCSARVPLR